MKCEYLPSYCIFFFGLYSEINRPVIVRMVPSATSRVIFSCRTIAEVMTVMTGTI